MRIEGDTVIFSSGRRRDANCGIIGLSPDLHVTGGYDQGFYTPLQEGMPPGDQSNALTPSERIELADYMIEQWQRFKNAVVR